MRSIQLPLARRLSHPASCGTVSLARLRRLQTSHPHLPPLPRAQGRTRSLRCVRQAAQGLPTRRLSASLSVLPHGLQPLLLQLLPQLPRCVRQPRYPALVQGANPDQRRSRSQRSRSCPPPVRSVCPRPRSAATSRCGRSLGSLRPRSRRGRRAGRGRGRLRLERVLRSHRMMASLLGDRVRLGRRRGRGSRSRPSLRWARSLPEIMGTL